MTKTITVRGRGFAPARPTEVVVSFESAAVRPTAAEAFAEAGKRHAALDALCDELGIDEARRTTTQTAVHEYREAGCTHVMLELWGERRHEQIRLFGERVLPAVR